MPEESIMKFEKVLPENFDGVFRFTNPSDEEFVGKWGSKEYLFPPKSTTPMKMMDFSPLEIQYIRKKFAKDLAEREFFKSKAYKGLAGQEGKSGHRTFSGIHQAATYTLTDLEPYIQECLKPMKESEITSRPMVKEELESKLSRDEEGSLQTEAIDKNQSVFARARNR